MSDAIGFRKKLALRQEKVNSLVCVGLDALPEKIPECIDRTLQTWERVLIQMKRIIDATAPYTCMYKPQKAHYEAIPGGQRTLQEIVDYIHMNYSDIPVFLDCKRGDIGRTQQRYRVAHFEIDRIDGMNFSPYMGKDCMEYLVDEKHPERALVGLCYTSNPSARQVQDIILDNGRRYWEFIAETTLHWAEELNVVDNAGLVMAAAYEFPKGSGNIFSEHLSRCREIIGDKMWLLIPGVGTQGGFIRETIEAGFCGFGSLAISSSSGITFESMDTDYAEASGRKTKELKNQINQWI